LSEWEKAIFRQEAIDWDCKVLAERIFPEDKYEVKSVYGYIEEDRGKCVIDFKRKRFEPFDCEEYCGMVGEEEEIEECVETCEENLEHVLTNSIKIDLETRTVEEATIAGNCDPIWCTEEETWEECEDRREKFFNQFRKLGCGITEAWIHPHELVRGGEWEEYPAVCFYHPKAIKRGECLLGELLREILEKV